MGGKRKSATSARAAKRSAAGAAAPSWRRRTVKWGLITALVLALIGSLGFVWVYVAVDIPDPNDEFLTETTHVYYSNGKSELGQFAIQRRESIDLEEMPAVLKDAVVAAENQSFWTDEGIDPKGILRAAFSNAQGNATQGASTITQQYVKILYLTQERTLTRKAKEAVLSLKIQNQLSKEEVLEGYLNTIYFGRGAYGVQAAAQAYFGIPAKRLQLRQAALLAAVLNNPVRYDPANGPDARANLKARYEYVLGAMADMEVISAEKAEKAQRYLPKLPKIEREDAYAGQKGHVLKMVRDQLIDLGFSEQEIDGGGLKVTTTFTRGAMTAAEEGVMEARPEGFSDKQLHIGVASVEPGTGAVRGLYGGQDYLESQLNWAVAGGQAGSTFKPFALAMALKAGWSLKDTFDGNSPYELPDGSDVENQGDQDYGSAVSLTKATQDSVNTAYIDLTLETPDGAQRIVNTAEDMGIPPAETPKKGAYGIPTNSPGLQANTGVALGSQTVSPINMANAYATIANDGVAAEPYIIEKVVDAEGRTRYNHKVATHEAISPEIAADVSYALQQVVQAGSGTAALALGRPAAGKTGTATNGRGEVSSAWFTGYTPQLATSVMYVRGKGNEQLQGWLPEYFGGAYPADTWLAVMQRAMEGLPVEDFPPPAYVDGEAPAEGHAPYTPPPPKPKATQPKPKPKPKPKPPKKTETVEPSPTQSTTKPGNGNSTTKNPAPTPTKPGGGEETTTGGGGNALKPRGRRRRTTA